MSHARNPIGSPRRWREGKARRVEQYMIEPLIRSWAVGIASNVTLCLRSKDIATAELAAAIDVSTTAVHQWATARETPSIPRLITMGYAMRCMTLAELLPEILLLGT